MANPLILFGLILGLIAGGLTYFYRRKLILSVIWFFVVFLGLGTLLHCFIFPFVSGMYINKLLYKYIKKNWVCFFISLTGIVFIFAVLSFTGKLYLPMKASGSMSIGEGLARGIGMGVIYGFFILAGIISYVASVFGISIYRFILKK